VSDEAVVRIARALTHRVCIRLIDELTSGEATVSDLAVRLRESQPSVSSHLALLRQAGLVQAEARGRHRVYRLEGAAAGLALSTLRSLGDEVGQNARRPRGAARGPAADAPIRRARTCYDHLAGEAGVELLDRLLQHRWLEQANEREYALTAAGAAGLAAAGVDVSGSLQARRRFAVACLDWTERRPHLGGALGAAVLKALLAAGVARLEPGSRVLNLGPLPWLR
jgi:DNA-binding transcriptional ArsR family regulator